MLNRILVIDDDVDFATVIYDLISKLVPIVEIAYSIEEAKKAIEETSYQVILLDINLNNRNGAEIIKHLTESENANKSTPLIIVSGIITAQFAEKYKERFHAILFKPIEPHELKAAIQKILDHSQEKEMNHPADSEDASDQLHADPEMHYAGPFDLATLKDEVHQVLNSIKKSSKVKQLFNQILVDRSEDHYLKSHISLLINISAALCTKLEWGSEKTLEKFVYAAYLHDLAIAQRPDLMRINSLAKLESMKVVLSEEEYHIVLEHPNIAAKMVAELNEVPSDVEIMIRQHHEFGNETGFPTKCNYQKITPFSAVFIVAHTLTDYILENPKWVMDDFIKKNKSKLHGSHFIKIVRALSQMK